MSKKKSPPVKWSPVSTSRPIHHITAELIPNALSALVKEPEGPTAETKRMVLDIVRRSQVPGFSIKTIEDIDSFVFTFASRLNEVSMIYMDCMNRSKIPKSKAIKKELEPLESAAEKLHNVLSNLSYPAKTALPHPFNDLNLLDNIKHYALGLQMGSQKASERLIPGKKKKSTAYMIELMNIYEDTFGRELGRSTTNSKPSGPFFRFAKACLAAIDPARSTGNETIKTDIQTARKDRDKYNERKREYQATNS